MSFNQECKDHNRGALFKNLYSRISIFRRTCEEKRKMKRKNWNRAEQGRQTTKIRTLTLLNSSSKNGG